MLRPQAMLFNPVDLPRSAAVRSAVSKLASASADARGAVFTRPEVVRFILDLVGYTPDRPLHTLRLLEPSFGGGEFLKEVILRLMASCERHGIPLSSASSILTDAVRAVELHQDSFQSTRMALEAMLSSSGVPPWQADALLDAWLICDDFLLADLAGGFDVVVGNPPYVRQESIADELMEEYRFRYPTIYDRADLYIPFIERGLDLLAPAGELGFICADRWMKNRYGGPLRRKITTEGFQLTACVDMRGIQSFDSEVAAYPAVFCVRKSTGNHAPCVRAQADAFDSLAQTLRHDPIGWTCRPAGDAPWVFSSIAAAALLKRLEEQLPLLEETGCKVGIGVASGADRVFIGPKDSLPIESDRKLPLAMAADLVDGEIHWTGNCIANPFDDDGVIVPEGCCPLMDVYFQKNSDVLKARHVAKNKEVWYRTIDRIQPKLARQPKLLIPDIKGHAAVAYDAGHYYPHHNLYWITSENWDLRALQALLSSDIAVFFVASYSVRMRGGFLRFQAQNLRRIRIPEWKSVPADIRHGLAQAAKKQDKEAGGKWAQKLYGLSDADMDAIRTSNLGEPQ